MRKQTAKNQFRSTFTEQNNAQEISSLVSQFVDNRPESVQMKSVQELADHSSRNQRLIQLNRMTSESASNAGALVQRNSVNGNVVQRQHKTIPAPSDEDVKTMDFLNARNRAYVKQKKLVSKGTHGTNWIHAISIMRGIKAQVPKNIRTSDVTPEEGGFFVDISKSGKEQSHDFAVMAAFGTQVEATPPSYMDADKKQQEFDAHVEKGKGTRRAIILEIWGREDTKPEARTKDQQSNEAIYRENAHLLVATLKDSL